MSVQRQHWRIGNLFWNWDHPWNKAEYFERRLQLTRETGYEDFEAKPAVVWRAHSMLIESYSGFAA